MPGAMQAHNTKAYSPEGSTRRLAPQLTGLGEVPAGGGPQRPMEMEMLGTDGTDGPGGERSAGVGRWKRRQLGSGGGLRQSLSENMRMRGETHIYANKTPPSPPLAFFLCFSIGYREAFCCFKTPPQTPPCFQNASRARRLPFGLKRLPLASERLHFRAKRLPCYEKQLKNLLCSKGLFLQGGDGGVSFAKGENLKVLPFVGHLQMRKATERSPGAPRPRFVDEPDQASRTPDFGQPLSGVPFAPSNIDAASGQARHGEA